MPPLPAPGWGTRGASPQLRATLGGVALAPGIPLGGAAPSPFTKVSCKLKPRSGGNRASLGGHLALGSTGPLGHGNQAHVFPRSARDPPRLATRKENAEVKETWRQPSIHLPPRAPAALTSISASAGPAPAAHDGAAGATPPSGPPLLPLPLPPAPAGTALEGALSGGGGGGGSAADDMFRLRHPPRPRAGAARREAAWACAALASGPPEERDPPASSHAQRLRHRPEPAPPRRSPRSPLPPHSAPLRSPAFTSRRESRRSG